MATFLVGHVEILIHFHSFINVDLFHQGLYQIRCHAYTRLDEGSDGNVDVISAPPLKLWQKDSEGSINEKDKSYSTRVFPIQYCDEEVDISEGIVFGVEVNVVDPRSQYTYVDFTLMFAEQDAPTCFAPAACQSIRIENPHHGIATHFKLTFDSFHFSTATLTIVSTMPDIKRGVQRRDMQRAAPVLPVLAFSPRAPPSLKYINKLSKSGQKVLTSQNVESKLNAVNDPERNLAMSLQADSPRYLLEAEGLQAESEGYRPAKSGSWSEPILHDFLSYFESCRKVCSTPPTAASSSGRGVTDIGEIMKERVDQVGKRFHELLLQNFYSLSVVTHTLMNCAVSKGDLRQMSWLKGTPPLRLPGGYTICAGMNGLPDLASLRGPRYGTTLHKSITLYINERLICDCQSEPHNAATSDGPSKSTNKSETLEDLGRFVSVVVPYHPISARPKIRENKKTLLADLHSVLIDDVNLFWCQIAEKWHKLCMLISLASRETAFFFEIIHSEQELRRLSMLFRREVITSGNRHVQTDPAQYHVAIAEQHRKSARLKAPPGPDSTSLMKSGVEDCHDNPSVRSVPLIFEEVYTDRGAGEGGGDKATGGQSGTHSGTRYAPLLELQEWMEEAIPVEREGDVLAQVHCRYHGVLGGGGSIVGFNEWATHLDPKPYDGLHLVVLVHGFRGNAFDLRIFKNYLQRLYPEHIYLLSSANEGKSDDDVTLQGSRLCDEIMKYVEDLCSWENIGRLSFVSHSLGGLITRAAVPMLLAATGGAVKPKLHLYMSLSTPHLGYTAARNRFVDAGLWVLKKWKRSQSLAQLCMADAKDYKETFLYSLSRNNALSLFKKIYLVSSPQDNYVPYESARIEYSQRVVNDPLWSKIYEDLVANIFQGIGSFIRLDVAFKIETKNIDSMIGRTAHINFLSSENLAYLITTRYAASFM